ncbi:MAG: Zn-dependent hydrolase [Halobacteriales archaeon]|nr:Zn-dependent hydrolase [Halobacteriales archaeon]
MTIDLDYDRFVATMQAQADIGSVGERALDRVALTDADRAIRDWFVEQLEALGLSVRIDEMGNIFGRRAGTDPDAPPVLVGSHLDSQPNGGIYDGPLGVVAGLELLRTLEDADIGTAHPIEIVNWTNEEGTRFQPAMMSSGVWAGVHDRDEIYDHTDGDGVRFEDALEDIGYKGTEPAEPPEDYEAYLELHVEQGPYLEANEKQVGVVTGIVGLSWGSVTFTGEADHAGPTPMYDRRDPMVAAADLITGIRRTPGTLGERTVATSGAIEADPNSINIIPEAVTVTWDTRDRDDAIIEAATEQIKQEAAAAAEREGVEYDIESRMRSRPTDFADRCVEAVQGAADELGYDSMRMHSGAGHDAAHMPEVCDTGMVFAVSEDGKSHSPEEYTSWDDCYAAANTLANAAFRLAE